MLASVFKRARLLWTVSTDAEHVKQSLFFSLPFLVLHMTWYICKSENVSLLFCSSSVFFFSQGRISLTNVSERKNKMRLGMTLASNPKDNSFVVSCLIGWCAWPLRKTGSWILAGLEEEISVDWIFVDLFAGKWSGVGACVYVWIYLH